MNSTALAHFAVTAVVVAILAPVAAFAQERPRPVLEFAAGVLQFPDDGDIVGEGFIGGNARIYVSPRVSLGPEVSFVGGDNHSHLILTGNVTWDFRQPLNEPAVVPYAVLGGGLFQTREQLFVGGTFTSSEGAYTAGGGVRFRASPNVTAGVEARMGWEAHIRLNATIGVRLGG
jgi:hypothetical protein